MEIDLYFVYRFLLAVSLGVLIGAERWRNRDEHEDTKKNSGFAGVRTYSFFSLIGFAGAFLSTEFSEWFLEVLLIVTGAIVVMAYNQKALIDKKITTASVLSMLVSFLTGVSAFYSPTFAILLAVAALLLLTTKKAFRHFVDTLSEAEFLATLKFIIIAAVVLPLLPQEPVDPWSLINPYEAWLLVVAVSAVSFIGYILTKLFGVEKGVGLAGAVGGLASSTATTIGLSIQSKAHKAIVHPFVLGMVVASTIMFLRVGLWVFFVNQDLLAEMIIPLAVMVIMSVVLLVLMYFLQLGVKKSLFNKQEIQHEEISLKSPFRLTPALQFGAFYVVLTIISHFLYEYYGQQGLYVASFLGGLADVDAITLSLARLSAAGDITAYASITGITLAITANTFVKAGIVFTIADRKVAKLTAAFLMIAVFSGLIASFLI